MWDLQLRSSKRDRRDQAVHDFLDVFRADMARAKSAAELAKADLCPTKPSDEQLQRYVLERSNA